MLSAGNRCIESEEFDGSKGQTNRLDTSEPPRRPSVVYAVLEVFVWQEDPEKFMEQVRGDDPGLPPKPRVEERELGVDASLNTGTCQSQCIHDSLCLVCTT